MGISCSGGGLDPSYQCLVDGHRNSANCPVANLYTITGIDSAVDLTTGVWVLTVANVGAGGVEDGMEGIGWVSTLTLYLLLVIMVLFLLSLALGPGAFLTLGLVLGWAGFGWFCCGQVCCSWVWDWGLGFGPSSLLTLKKFSSSG